MANANLTCPLCRIRFASWLRIAKKEDRLVNGKLWTEIQSKFSEKVRNRQAGVEEHLEEAPKIRLTNAGEIRREYEEQLQREREQIAKQHREEEAASAELIKKLKEEDARQQRASLQPNNSLNTLRKRPLDKLIQNMQKHLNVVPSRHATRADVQLLPTAAELPQSIASTSSACPIPEKSTKQKNLMHFAEVIEISDSNDSIENECRYFKPIDSDIPLPATVRTPLKVPATMNKHHSFKFEPPNKTQPINFSEGSSAFVRFITQSRKRKLSDKVLRKPVDECLSSTSLLKIPHTMTLRERKPSNSSPPHLLPAASILNGLKITEFSKLEQERSDLELAKKLQEEFNRERYTTRSSISCRNNIKKARQLTLTEIMSTSKCK